MIEKAPRARSWLVVLVICAAVWLGLACTELALAISGGRLMADQLHGDLGVLLVALSVCMVVVWSAERASAGNWRVTQRLADLERRLEDTRPVVQIVAAPPTVYGRAPVLSEPGPSGLDPETIDAIAKLRTSVK